MLSRGMDVKPMEDAAAELLIYSVKYQAWESRVQHPATTDDRGLMTDTAPLPLA